MTLHRLPIAGLAGLAIILSAAPASAAPKPAGKLRTARYVYTETQAA